MKDGSWMEGIGTRRARERAGPGGDAGLGTQTRALDG